MAHQKSRKVTKKKKFILLPILQGSFSFNSFQISHVFPCCHYISTYSSIFTDLRQFVKLKTRRPPFTFFKNLSIILWPSMFYPQARIIITIWITNFSISEWKHQFSSLAMSTPSQISIYTVQHIKKTISLLVLWSGKRRLEVKNENFWS